MKKAMSLALASMLVLGMFAGCSQSPASSTETSQQPQVDTSQSTQGSEPAPVADGKIKIAYLNGFTGGDGAFMRKITDGFNASQDRIVVEELQERDHYVKFETGEFDLVVLHGDLLATYVADEMVQPVDGIYEKANLKPDDFLQAGQDIVNFDGQSYAFPLDIHPLTMFYNKKLVPEPPKTYEEIKALKETLPANVYPMGVPGAGLVEWYMMFIAAQNGVEVSEGNAMKYDTDGFADSILLLNTMIFEDKVSPEGLGLDGEFNTFINDQPSETAPQTAIALTGPWFYSAAKEKYGDDLGVAPLPAIGKQTGTYGNAHTIAVSSKVTDQAKLDAIAEYLGYMFQPENIMHWTDSGQAPLIKAAEETILANQAEYPLPYANLQQFQNAKIAPPVYQVREQTRYLNENIYATLVTKPGMTKEELMPELQKATNFAKEIAE